MAAMDGNAWNDMSSEYDNCVERNDDRVISGFVGEEIRIVADLCGRFIEPDKKYTIIDMGSGTGRVLLSLNRVLGSSVSFCGLEASKPMIGISRQKQPSPNVSFVHCDVTDSDVCGLFRDDSVKITLCMYNTIGVIPPSKREQFSDNMRGLAGDDGFALISAFNGDDFAFAAPRIYRPMKGMVRRIDDDSFDEQRLAFRNSLGYYSQWFTRDQIRELLRSDVPPIPINVPVDGRPKTFGHVFTDRPV